MAKLLEGKSAVVTGGGRGIGKEICIAFARQGANVVVNDLGGATDGSGSDKSPADEVVGEIKNLGGEAVANYDSVADFAAAENIIQTCVKNFGRIDILANLAGITRMALAQDTTEQDFDDVVAVNLKGTFNCSRHAFRTMINQSFCRTGRIINFTSDAWRTPVPNQLNYAASKGGVVGLTRALAAEGKLYGVTCNAIAPLAGTRLIGTMTPKIADWMLKKGLVDQWLHDRFLDPGPADHVPPIVVYLASDHAANITGRIFGASQGRVAIYAEPKETARLYKDDGSMWTPEELVQLVPEKLIKAVL